MAFLQILQSAFVAKIRQLSRHAVLQNEVRLPGVQAFYVCLKKYYLGLDYLRM